MLACDYDYEPEAGDICFIFAEKRSALQTKRPRICRSCNAKINPGENSLEILRYKVPEYDVELRIYGDDCCKGPPRASFYLCGLCGEIALFLQRKGYALQLSDDMRDLLCEYDYQCVETGQGGCA